MIGVITPCRCSEGKKAFCFLFLSLYVLSREKQKNRLAKGMGAVSLQGVFGGHYHVAACCI